MGSSEAAQLAASVAETEASLAGAQAMAAGARQKKLDMVQAAKVCHPTDW